MVLNKSFQSFELFTKALVKNNFLLNSGIGSNYYNPLTTDNIIPLHLPQNHHLKLGRGWAWAGHISANWDAALVLNVEDSDFELNCGLVPPIGSNKNIGIFDTPYLRVILDWMQVRKGSLSQESHVKIYTYLALQASQKNLPVWGQWKFLSRTKQGQWTTKILLKSPHQFWIRWNSG